MIFSKVILFNMDLQNLFLQNDDEQNIASPTK